MVAAWDATIDRSRTRSRSFDHVWQARERYGAMFGPRLAAAIAYYGFFAAFAIGLLGYSVLGFVLGNNRAVLDTVNEYLQRNLPFLNPSAIQSARNTIAVIGLLGLLFAGIGWIDSMRSSQRAMWGLDQHPGNVVIRRLIDLGILVGSRPGARLSGSGRRLLLEWAVRPCSRSPSRSRRVRWTTHETSAGFGEALSSALNLLMSAALLLLVPRLWVSWYRIVWPTVLVGVGLRSSPRWVASTSPTPNATRRTGWPARPSDCCCSSTCSASCCCSARRWRRPVQRGRVRDLATPSAADPESGRRPSGSRYRDTWPFSASKRRSSAPGPS